MMSLANQLSAVITRFETRSEERPFRLCLTAEGFERDGDREFLQFLFVAKGSCGEVRAQLYLAYDRKYITEEEFGELTQKTLQLSRMIAGLTKYLRQSQITGKKYKVASQQT